MWSFRDDDTPGSPRGYEVDGRFDAADLTAAMLRYHVDRAQRMRSEAMAALLRRLATAMLRPFRRTRDQAPTAGQAEADCRTRVEGDLKTPVTSIRAAAEILRDHTDVPVEERACFLEAIIEDSRRLELFADRLLAGIKPRANRRGRRRTAGRDPSLEQQAA